jgi:hypothetical protein
MFNCRNMTLSMLTAVTGTLRSIISMQIQSSTGYPTMTYQLLQICSNKMANNNGSSTNDLCSFCSQHSPRSLGQWPKQFEPFFSGSALWKSILNQFEPFYQDSALWKSILNQFEPFSQTSALWKSILNHFEPFRQCSALSVNNDSSLCSHNSTSTGNKRFRGTQVNTRRQRLEIAFKLL